MQNNLTTANGTDALLWQKAEKHLMPFGIPFSPIIVHKAKGSYLYVGLLLMYILLVEHH